MIFYSGRVFGSARVSFAAGELGNSVTEPGVPDSGAAVSARGSRASSSRSAMRRNRICSVE